VIFDDGFFGRYEPLLPLVEIIKVDIRQNDIESVKRMIERLVKGDSHLLYLAEKVESMHEFRQYKDAGCTLFQGYFFAKPEVSERRSLDPSVKTLFELTGLLADDTSTTAEIADAFEGAPDLALQLLQFLNSSHFAFKSPIRSISHAIMMIGKHELLTWLYMLAYANGNLSKIESSPLVSLAGFRSKLMRRISELHADSKELRDMAAFTGTLSLADSIFEMPMGDLLKEIEVDESIKYALLYKRGELADYLEIAKSVERADFEESIEIAKSLGVDAAELESAILESYRSTMR